MTMRSQHAMSAVAIAACLIATSEFGWPRALIAQTTPAVKAAVDTDRYRVDMQVQQSGEHYVMRRSIDGSRSRTEMDYDGTKIITIELGDAAGTTYTLLPDEKRAMKSTQAAARAAQAAPASSAPAPADLPPMVLVGTETIEGKRARKYRVTTPQGEGLMWLDADTDLPLRMEGGGATVEMRNYDFSPLAADLFQVPKGYEIVDVDQLMRLSAGRMAARGVVGALGSHLGASAGAQAGGGIGASIGGAIAGPVGSMIGQFFGQHFGKKAGGKAGAAAAGLVP